MAAVDPEISSIWLFRRFKRVWPARSVAAASLPRSYGGRGAGVQGSRRAIGGRTLVVIATVAALFVSVMQEMAMAAEREVQIVAFGDSLTAGYGLPEQASFPVKLEKALKAHNRAVKVINVGVSGDTTTDGLARVDWSVPDGTDLVILELGANDALRGIDPKIPRAALGQIVARLKARGISVLLCGMKAPPNMGSDYVGAFDSIFPDLAKAESLPLYPFFLDGVAADPKLNQGDGIHPTAGGVDIIVANMLPMVEALVAGIAVKPKS